MKNQKQQIRAFYSTHKRLPTYREMGELLGNASKGGVVYYVHKLIQEQFLARDGAKIVRGPEFFHINVLGSVEAGFPTIAEEDLLHHDHSMNFSSITSNRLICSL